MAAIIPSDLFTGYELLEPAGPATAKSIAIPLASLTGLTAAEADEVTGDGREIIRILLSTAKAKIDALPAEDRPTKMTMSSGTAITGPNSRRLDITTSFSVTVPDSAYNIDAE
jgi:hypothetical protein